MKLLYKDRKVLERVIKDCVECNRTEKLHRIILDKKLKMARLKPCDPEIWGHGQCSHREEKSAGPEPSTPFLRKNSVALIAAENFQQYGVKDDRGNA